MPPTRSSSLMNTQPRIGQELLDVPMGEMIKQMAFAIAEAQMKLDSNSIEVAQMLGGLQRITDTNANGEEVVVFEDSRVFFGKEKILLSSALDTYNSTSDIYQRSSISAAINITGNNDVELRVNGKPVVVASVDPTGSASVNFTPNGEGGKKTNVYYVNSTQKYYDFDDNRTTSNKYAEITNPVKTYKLRSTSTDRYVYIPTRVSMLELGFTPTFYQFVDTIIEVKISIKYTQEGSQTSNEGSFGMSSSGSHSGLRGLIFGGNRSSAVATSHVNASYSQKYSYSAEGSSLLRTKLVPIPPPAILEEKIRQQMEVAKETPPVSTTPTT
jgi:hypothetical protein